MPPLTASVIVVSRHRPKALALCVTALLQQDFTGFELIVVADPAAVETLPSCDGVTILGFDEPNISKARNLGLIHATGDVIAFIDDDAVAEPTWLSRLVATFTDARVVAATGFVRGRNGISYQWQASAVDSSGADHPLAITAATILPGTPDRAVKTQGTNCAFRRADLLAIGGFDPALHFYLDDADVALRLAARGATAILPDAEVQHGYAASSRRSETRVPLDLGDIAASTAVFLRRHRPGDDLAPALMQLRAQQEARLQRHLAAGTLTAAKAEQLRASLETGWAAGLIRPLPPLSPLQPQPRPPFRALPTQPRPRITLAGRFWQRRRLLAKARQLVQSGHIVTVICLSPTPRRHRMQFLPDGFWLQTGGIFGQSIRSGPALRWVGFSRRIQEETRRLARVRAA